MSDVIAGPDGKARCAWAGDDSPLVSYHDKVWGKRTYDESALFEALTLGVFQAGSAGRSCSESETRSRRSFTASTSPESQE